MERSAAAPLDGVGVPVEAVPLGLVAVGDAELEEDVESVPFRRMAFRYRLHL